MRCGGGEGCCGCSSDRGGGESEDGVGGSCLIKGASMTIGAGGGDFTVLMLFNVKT